MIFNDSWPHDKGQFGSYVRHPNCSVFGRGLMPEGYASNEGFLPYSGPNYDIMNALFASVDDGIIVSDLNGKIIFSNNAALKMNCNEALPEDPKERMRHYSFQIGDSERPVTFDELPSSKALYEGQIKRQKVVLNCPDGQKKALICNGRALYSREGNKVGAVMVFHDNTQQSSIENQKNILEKEKNHLLHINQELERFSAVAAHDLKSPLNSITQFAELLKEDYGDKLGSDGGELLQVIMNAGARLRNLIDDLLSYARGGKDLGEMTLFDSRLLVDEIIDSLRGNLQKVNASFEIGPLPALYADRTGISQVFQNLISNAIKYRKSEPLVIQIQSQDSSTGWHFQIADNGIGFQPEDQKSAFDVFKRFGGSQKIEGSGLGLPICKRIIELHGGSIWLTSKKGIGTTFYFTLPKPQPHQ